MIRKTAEPPALVTVSLSIDAIAPNPKNARKRADDKELAGMAESIASVGVIEPVVVRPLEAGGGKGHARYELVAGERRWRAARQAGLSEVPAIIRDDLDAGGAAVLGLVENLQREDLNPLEEAAALKSLKDEHGMTARELGKMIGHSEGRVNMTLRFLELPPRWQGWLASRAILRQHAECVLTFLGDERVMKDLERNVDADLKAGTLRGGADLRELGRWLSANPSTPDAPLKRGRRTKGAPELVEKVDEERDPNAGKNQMVQNQPIDSPDRSLPEEAPHLPGPEALARFRAAWLRQIVADEVLDRFPVIASRLWLLLLVAPGDERAAAARRELLRQAIAAAGLGAFKLLDMSSVARADRAALAQLRVSLLREMVLYDRDGMTLVSDELVEAAASQGRVNLETIWKRESEDGGRQHFAGSLTGNFWTALRDDQVFALADRWGLKPGIGHSRERVLERLEGFNRPNKFPFPPKNLIRPVEASNAVLGEEGHQ
jgi:ParB family transcriptional regulator, chromosome partitioning protein